MYEYAIQLTQVANGWQVVFPRPEIFAPHPHIVDYEMQARVAKKVFAEDEDPKLREAMKKEKNIIDLKIEHIFVFKTLDEALACIKFKLS